MQSEKKQVDVGATSPLHEAVRNMDVTALKEALSKTKDVDRIKNGLTPLAMAVRLGHLESVKCLVEHKASVDQAPGLLCVPLNQACLVDSIEITEYLLEQRANINELDDDGWTPLMCAVYCSTKDVVQMLMAHRADTSPRATNSLYRGKNALDLARSRNNRDIIELLGVEQPPPAPPAPSIHVGPLG